jgi:hypothetical protein
VKLAVIGHVLGVASIAWGIANRGSRRGPDQPPSGDAPSLIVVVIALSMPFCRRALETVGTARSAGAYIQAM